jgi:hypothetical protein
MGSDENPHEEMWRGLLTDPQSPLHADRMQFKLLPGSVFFTCPWTRVFSSQVKGL